MATYNQIQIKSYEQLLPKFSSEPGLQYCDKFEFSNNSIYRGQMKKIDDNLRKQMQQSDASSNTSGQLGALQNRLSAKATSTPKDNQMNGVENFNDSADMGQQPRVSENSLTNIVRHGYGIQVWTDGAHYEGQWVCDVKEGKGTMTYVNGEKYEGEWKNDKAHGKGTLTYVRGDKYVGDWWEAKKHGYVRPQLSCFWCAEHSVVAGPTVLLQW